MHIIIISGFLGSGKTSVLLKLAEYIASQHPEAETPVAIIENEIGSVSVDGSMLAGSNGAYSVTNLFSGCVCCTLMVEMTAGVQKISEEVDPLYAIIEPSGVADPETIARNLKTYLGFEARIVTLVDAERWEKIKAALSALIPSQLSDASVVLVNKIDKVGEVQLEQLHADVRAHNDSAPIYDICANEGIATEILQAMLGEEDVS